MIIERQNIGLDLVVIGSIITTIGVFFNNVMLNHILAMQVWVISNTIFAIFFFGRAKDWWDGAISDWVMCWMYLFMLASGLWGLMQ